MSCFNRLAIMLSILAFSVASYCRAGDSYISGSVFDFSSTTAGLMIRMDSGVPANCLGTPYGWMLIKAENKAMIALVLTWAAQGKKSATVYTNPIVSNSFCEINQYDPVD